MGACVIASRLDYSGMSFGVCSESLLIVQLTNLILLLRVAEVSSLDYGDTLSLVVKVVLVCLFRSLVGITSGCLCS